MADADPTQSGVQAWMASVRASMENDPCRQLFEDQLQTHAFIFLDDYLEHILAGPKQAPIIELVKTPARKKNLPRRTRAAAPPSAKNTSFSLDDHNFVKDVPVNSFHKALLQAKERSVQDAPDLRKPPAVSPPTSTSSVDKTHTRLDFVRVLDAPEITVSIVPEPQAGAILQHGHKDLSGESLMPFQASERGIALSVIAEGDESPERGHTHTLPLSTVVSDHGELSGAIPQVSHEADRYPATEENFQIIQNESRIPLTETQYLGSPSTGARDTILPGSPQEVQLPGVHRGNHTEPLPSRDVFGYEKNAFTAPLPVVPVSNTIPIPHTIFVPLNDSSPGELAHKSGPAGFPTLPAPSPLRKSMRFVQEVLANSTVPASAPAPALLGKRTSWLMKAREAKAMEGTTIVPGTSLVASSTTLSRGSIAVKRKSGEMLGAPPSGSDWDKDQRKHKIIKSTGVGVVPLVTEVEENNQRNFLSVQDESILPSSLTPAISVDHLESHVMDVDQQITRLNPTDEGFIDLFKRTVEGLGAHTRKSMDKSLGGAAAIALAEARAAAEAKVAERNKVNSESSDSEILHDNGLSDQGRPEAQTPSTDQLPFVPALQVDGTERPLSFSDLALNTGCADDPMLLANVVPEMDLRNRANANDESVSTTPPDSPPSKGSSGFVKPAGPVFNKQPAPPVFIPPAPKQPSVVSGHPKEFPFSYPQGQFTLPVAVPLGIPARLISVPHDLPPVQGTSQVSAQSSQSSVFSDQIFDKDGGIPAWVSSTQDTSYTIDPQPHDEGTTSAAIIVDDDEDDDSWPLEEKLSAAEPGWRPFDFSNMDKEDTWSSLPTESQGPTRNLTAEKGGDAVPLANNISVDVETNNNGPEREQETVEALDAERSIMEASELEEIADTRIVNFDRAESTARGTSQVSMASTASSSQSQGGFFGQASKVVNSMLGGGKKVRPELKSLQLAAAAAKKQQEEADKKMQRLKDMEARRQVATARKAEEERTRLLEEERKSREELEKRKREREENTDRRPLKPPVSVKKAEDDASKKRRLASETEKKPESKKPPSKDRKDLVLSTKPTVAPATKLAAQKSAKASTTALLSSTAYNTTQNAQTTVPTKPIVPEAKPFKVVPSSLKGKAKTKPQEDDMGERLPSNVVQTQMAARVKAQMQAAKLPAEVPSESIELPEINSEYSDSEDEDRVRTFDPPDWAQSPELRQALQMQSTVNPDDIFGAIRPLRMEEVFRTRQSRFRARTSSANWTGSDRLTVEEIREYERRMGFQQAGAS